MAPRLGAETFPRTHLPMAKSCLRKPQDCCGQSGFLATRYDIKCPAVSSENTAGISTLQLAEPCGVPKRQGEELRLGARAGSTHSSGVGSNQHGQGNLAQDGTDTFRH